MLQWLPAWVRKSTALPAPVYSGESPPYEAFGKYPADPDGFPVLDPMRLIDHQADLIKSIRRSARFTDAPRWDALFDDAIRRYAHFVHLLPASENDHHRGVGGLFRHGLEVAHKSILLGYAHAQDMTNFPSHNRKLEERWSYACFIAGLCHDLGKAVSDMTVTDRSGELQWSPYTETLIEWAQRHSVKRYFIHYRPNRHKRHSAYSVKVSHHIIRKEGDLFLSDVSDQLMQDVTDAIMGSTASLASIVRYVTQADAMSCEEDRKRNPIMDIASAGHTAAAPAHKYLYDAIRNCINDRVWKPNETNSPLFIINRSVYLIWPRALPEILSRIGVERGVPTSHMTIAEMLEERGLIVQYNPDAHNVHTYWSILPEPLEKQGVKRPLKAICLDKASRFFDVEPPSVGAKIYDPVAASRIPANASSFEIEPRAQFQPITPRKGAIEPEATDTAAPAPTPPPTLAPQEPPGTASPSTTPPSPAAAAAPPAAPAQPRSSPPRVEPPEPAPPPDYDDRLIGILGGPVSADPPPYLDFELLSKTPIKRTSTPDDTGGQRQQNPLASQPKVGGQSNNLMEHQMFFQRSEHAIGVTLLSLVQRLVEDPDRPEHTLIARHKDMLVIQYPEGVADLGLQPKTIVDALRAADWLTHELTLPPIKDNVVFPRSIVISREISRRLFALLHGVEVSRSTPEPGRIKAAIKAMRAIVGPTSSSPTNKGQESQLDEAMDEPLFAIPKSRKDSRAPKPPPPQVITIEAAPTEAAPLPIVLPDLVEHEAVGATAADGESSEDPGSNARPAMGRKAFLRRVRKAFSDHPGGFSKTGNRFVIPVDLLFERLSAESSANFSRDGVLAHLRDVTDIKIIEEHGGAWASIPQIILTQGAK